MKKYLVITILACFVITLAGPSILRGKDYKIDKPEATKSKITTSADKSYKTQSKSTQAQHIHGFRVYFNIGLPGIPLIGPYIPVDDSGSGNRFESSTNPNPNPDYRVVDRDTDIGDDTGWEDQNK